MRSNKFYLKIKKFIRLYFKLNNKNKFILFLFCFIYLKHILRPQANRRKLQESSMKDSRKKKFLLCLEKTLQCETNIAVIICDLEQSYFFLCWVRENKESYIRNCECFNLNSKTRSLTQYPTGSTTGEFPGILTLSSY